MLRLFRTTSNRSFFATQLFSFVGINVLVLGLVAFITLHGMVSTVNAIVDHSIKALISQTATRIDSEIARIVNDMRSVSSLQSIQEYLDAPLFAKTAWQDQVQAELKNFLRSHKEITLVHFIPTAPGDTLAMARDDDMQKATLELTPELKAKILDPSLSLRQLEPGSVKLKDAGGVDISHKFVFFAARVMDRSRPVSVTTTVNGYLLSAVPAWHFQTALAALNLAGADAPPYYQTNSFLLDREFNPVTQVGPEAEKLSDKTTRAFVQGVKGQLAALDQAQDSDYSFSSEALDFPTASVYSVEEPTTHWKVLALVPEAYVLRDVRGVRNLIVTVLLAGVFVAFLLTYLASKRITKPIGDLVEATEYVSAGNLDRPIHLNSFKEFNTLGQNFNAMTGKLKETIAERVSESEHKASLELELQTASLFQKLFLPSGSFEALGVELEAHYQPASHMGGDWFSYGVTSDDWLHVHLGDVTGHGTASALVASFCKGVTDAFYQGRQDIGGGATNVPIESIHQCLNNLLFNNGQNMALMTMLSIALDLKTGELRYVSSGHPPQFLIGTDGGKAVPLVSRADSSLLGFKALSRVELSGTIQVRAGQGLFLYSDGLLDVVRQDGRPFNIRRLGKFLTEHREASPAELKEKIKSGLLTSSMPVDDVTFIAIRVKAMVKNHIVAA